MITRSATGRVVACAVALAGACAGGGETRPEPSSTSVATTAATPAMPTAVATQATTRPAVDASFGSAVLEAVARAVRERDAPALVALSRLTPLGCGPQQGSGSLPRCPDGAAEGTPVPVLGVSSCEGGVYARDALPGLLEGAWRQGPPELLGAYGVPPGGVRPA